jgi:hypothetical protein
MTAVMAGPAVYLRVAPRQGGVTRLEVTRISTRQAEALVALHLPEKPRAMCVEGD